MNALKYASATLLAITIGTSRTAAQEPGVVVYGTVRDMVSRDSIPFPDVSLQEVGSDLPPYPIVTTARGRYTIQLTEQRVYVICFGAPRKVGKCVQLDLRGPSAELWKLGYGMNIDPTVMDSLLGVDYSMFIEPFGKAYFDPVSEIFEWDVEYTRFMRDRQEAVIREYRERTGTSPSSE